MQGKWFCEVLCGHLVKPSVCEKIICTPCLLACICFGASDQQECSCLHWFPVMWHLSYGAQNSCWMAITSTHILSQARLKPFHIRQKPANSISACLWLTSAFGWPFQMMHQADRKLSEVSSWIPEGRRKALPLVHNWTNMTWMLPRENLCTANLSFLQSDFFHQRDTLILRCTR